MWYNSFVTKNRKIIVYNKYIDKEAWGVYNALTDRQTTCLRITRDLCCFHIKSKKAEPLSEKIRRSPAAADLTAVCRLDIYGKTVSCISLKNPENPHKH